MEVYFDNSATTAVYPEVIDLVVSCMREDYGNPSSLHKKGLDAEHFVKNAVDIISKQMKCTPQEIIFTSGGTESNNTAIIGTALAKRRKGKHIITTEIEHSSVAEVMNFLVKEGYEVTRIPAGPDGKVDPEAFAEAVRKDTILVSCMHVNNEVGAIQPVKEIAKLCKKNNPDVIVHVDAIQSFGKIPVIPSKMGADLVSVSGHKLHAPKGTGILYVKQGTLLRPIIYGGGQQRGMRSGTENVPGIAGLGKAVELSFKNFDERVEYIKGIKESLREGMKQFPDVIDHSQDAPHIASFSFIGVRAEVLLHTLEEAGIYVSSGSACSSNANKKRYSAVLTSMGLPEEELESTLRFSFSEYNKPEEVEYTLEKLGEILPRLRHYKRG